MMRHCDGTDRNLMRERKDGEDPGECIWPGMVACDCGRVFDDVWHSTIYPHKHF
jgi:hypothetical protein